MVKHETQVLNELEVRSRMQSYATVVDEVHRNWVPNPDRVENPLGLVWQQGGNPLEGFTPARIVDLMVLKPEDLVVFRISASPTYLLKMEEDDQVTAWINTVYGGLSASIGDLSTVRLVSRGKDQPDKVYPGGLIVNGFRRMQTRVVMPYFSFDGPANVEVPVNAWFDAITGIWVKNS